MGTLRITAPVVTERLVLRPFTPADIDDVHAIQSRPDVVRYLYWGVRTREEVAAVVAKKAGQTTLAQEGDVLALAIELAGASGTKTGVIGEVVLWWHSVQHQQGEIGFVLHPAFQRQGYAREAAEAVIDMGFGQLDLHRIYGRTDGRNEASAGLMRRLGMRQEAHFVENERFKGDWGDELVFAILRREWEARCEG